MIKGWKFRCECGLDVAISQVTFYKDHSPNPAPRRYLLDEPTEQMFGYCHGRPEQMFDHAPSRPAGDTLAQ